MEAPIIRPVLLTLLLAAPALWAAETEAPLAPRMAHSLSIQLPEGTPDAAERRQLLERLQQDQRALLAEVRRQSAQIATLDGDIRATQGERGELLVLARLLASAIGTVLTAAALWALLRQKVASRQRRGGAWYRAGARPARKLSVAAQPARPADAAALSPLAWTENEGAETVPFVREFGRGANRTAQAAR